MVATEMFTQKHHQEDGTTTGKTCCEWQQLFASTDAASLCVVLLPLQTNDAQATKVYITICAC